MRFLGSISMAQTVLISDACMLSHIGLISLPGINTIDSTTLLQSAHVVLRGGVASSGGATQPKLGGPT